MDHHWLLCASLRNGGDGSVRRSSGHRADRGDKNTHVLEWLPTSGARHRQTRKRFYVTRCHVCCGLIHHDLCMVLVVINCECDLPKNVFGILGDSVVQLPTYLVKFLTDFTS